MHTHSAQKFTGRVPQQQAKARPYFARWRDDTDSGAIYHVFQAGVSQLCNVGETRPGLPRCHATGELRDVRAAAVPQEKGHHAHGIAAKDYGKEYAAHRRDRKGRKVPAVFHDCCCQGRGERRGEEAHGAQEVRNSLVRRGIDLEAKRAMEEKA
jgi:hypothetical protein